MGWIRIRMDPELLPGSGSGINHSGSTTLNESLWFYTLTTRSMSRSANDFCQSVVKSALYKITKILFCSRQQRYRSFFFLQLIEKTKMLQRFTVRDQKLTLKQVWLRYYSMWFLYSIKAVNNLSTSSRSKSGWRSKYWNLMPTRWSGEGAVMSHWQDRLGRYV